MNSKAFRAELVKIMPGYNWTVHKPRKSYSGVPSETKRLEASGIMSSGSNRLSTLCVIRVEREAKNPYYEVKSSGFGVRAPWLHTHRDGTLARALRGLQDHYEYMANKYRGHAASLEYARKPENAAATQIAKSLTATPQAA